MWVEQTSVSSRKVEGPVNLPKFVELECQKQLVSLDDGRLSLSSRYGTVRKNLGQIGEIYHDTNN